MSNELPELSKVKEIKIVNEFSNKDTEDKVNQYLSNGWIVLTVEKYVNDETSSESVHYHLGLL